MQDDCITVALGLPELRVLGQHEEGHQITVEVMYRTRRVRCPGCDQETVRVHSMQRQWKQDRRLWDKPVVLVLHKRRFRCGACRKVFTEPDPVFGLRRRSSQRFRSYLGREAVDQPVRHVARKEGVGEGLVRLCVTELAQRLLQVPAQPPPVRILGLDEFSIKKGQVYDTALMDLEHKQVVGVVSGHRQAEVQQFLEGLSAPEQVVAVVMDMHEPFRQAVQLCLPQARVVVDKFHVLAQVHRALDQVRTSLQPERGKKGELFRARYLLLSAAERLGAEQRARLQGLLARYPALARAWALKESFRQWYASPDRASATARLEAWETGVRAHGPAPFLRLFPMLRDWRQEILNYFDCRYTNGFVEGKNNRIKVIKRLAYGYRNRDNFRQRILLTNVRVGEPRAA